MLDILYSIWLGVSSVPWWVLLIFAFCVLAKPVQMIAKRYTQGGGY